jgi:hypothetical protein
LNLAPVKKLIVANVLLPVNSNETLLQELSISLLKNARQIVFESSKILLSTVALESRFNLLSKRSELLFHKTASYENPWTSLVHCTSSLAAHREKGRVSWMLFHVRSRLSCGQNSKGCFTNEYTTSSTSTFRHTTPTLRTLENLLRSLCGL